MTYSDLVSLKLPSPLLDALHRRMIATGQTEAEVLLAALSTYLNLETVKIETVSVEMVSVRQEVTLLRQELARVQQRLAIVEQFLRLPLSEPIASSPLASHLDTQTVRKTADAKEFPVAAPRKAVSFEDIEDEPDEILYGFLEPGSNF